MNDIKKVRENLDVICDKLDEIHMLLCDMTNATNNVFDVLDERNDLREWETKLREHYNEYVTNKHLKAN